MRRFLLLGGKSQQVSSYQGEVKKRYDSLKSLTIMPNVHEVRTILRAAVRINRKTFSRVAVGLANY
jgi:hypothetical protein